MKKLLIILMILCLVTTVSAESPAGAQDSSSWYDGVVSCLIIGVVIGGIAVGVMAFKMKSVRSKSSAADYVERDSLVLRIQQDRYLYQTVTRRPRPKNNNSRHD